MSRRLGQEGFECVNGLLDGKGGTLVYGVRNGFPKIQWRKYSQLGPPKPQGPHRPVATLLGGRVFTGRHRSRPVVTGCYGAKGGRPVWISALSAKAAGPKKGGDEVSVSGPQTLERSFQNK